MEKGIRKIIAAILSAVILSMTLTSCSDNEAEITTTAGTSASENTTDGSSTTKDANSSSTTESTTAKTENTSGTDVSTTTSAKTDKTDATAVTTTTAATTTKTPAVNPAELVVSFSQSGGVFSKAFELKLSCSAATTIYYTTDGSDPTTSKTRKVYSAPISIKDRSGDANYVSAVDPVLFDGAFVKVNSRRNGFDALIDAPSDDAVDKCTVIRAAAADSLGNFGKAATNTYFIEKMSDHIEGISASCKAAGTDLAVISISMNYEDLFDAKTGIYVRGEIFDNALADYLASRQRLTEDTSRRLAANYNQRGSEWERTAHIEFFECDASSAELAFSQDCGIRIQGNYSRSDLQKGFRLYADEEYGKKNFKYAVFGDGLKDDSGNTIEKFKTLKLRAGGNCAFTAKFNDTYWQSLVTDMSVETQASRACVVYIDGEYWGLYVLEEDYSDNFFENKHGVSDKDVVLYKGDAETYEIGYKLDLGDIPAGQSVSYYFKDLLNFFNKHDDLESQSDYNEFIKLVDPQSVMDYFAIESWINNKWDWPGKNWSIWKTTTVNSANPYNDGRWRFCLYDVEFGGVSGSQDAYTNTIKEDNYQQYGLLDMNTKNPAVLCYAYLMTNEGFRTQFNDRLLSLSDTNFKYATANAALTKFTNIYEPLFDQFFERYEGAGTTEDAVNGGYASVKCIRDFLSQRSKNIQKLVNYVNNHYK